MKKSPLAVLAAIATATALALTGCVAAEDTPAEPLETGARLGEGGWSSTELNIDFATYNPLSLIIKDQGWLEETLGGKV